jgi:hypothetical protein
MRPVLLVPERAAALDRLALLRSLASPLFLLLGFTIAVCFARLPLRGGSFARLRHRSETIERSFIEISF